MTECNCGAARDGKWADVHTEGCPALYVTDGDGPAASARRLVGAHIAKHGPIRGAEALIEEIATELAFLQLAATPSPYEAKCKRKRADGPTPCLCCPGECIG